MATTISLIFYFIKLSWISVSFQMFIVFLFPPPLYLVQVSDNLPKTPFFTDSVYICIINIQDND